VYERDASTPRKSKEAPTDWEYLLTSLYPPQHLEHLKTVVDRVQENAQRCSKSVALEGQWGSSTVYKLLTEFENWYQELQVLNV